MMMRKLWIICLVVIAAAAHAAPSASLEKARQHFKAGESLFRSGDYEKAIVEYQAAYGLAPRPLLLFNIGAAYRKKAEAGGSVDDKKQAVEYYRKYVDADPGGKGVADANGFIASLGQEIAAAEAAAKPPEPVAKPPEPEPAAPKPLAPAPAPAPKPPAPTTTVVSSPEPTPPPAPADSGGGSTLRIAGIATAGVGVALFATGIYFGLKAKSISDEVDGLHDHWDQNLYDSGQSAQRNMYLFAGAGAVAIAGGAVMYFVLGKKDEGPAISVRPSVSPAAGVLVLSGQF